MTTLLLTVVLFAFCMAGLGLGMLLQGRALARSCGANITDKHGAEVACGACAKKEAEVCPTDDKLVALAQIAHPNPRHHH